jgi:hypothetical protein
MAQTLAGFDAQGHPQWEDISMAETDMPGAQTLAGFDAQGHPQWGDSSMAETDMPGAKTNAGSPAPARSGSTSMSSSINLSSLFPDAPSGLMDIIKQLQGAQDAANTANEKRYQETLGQFDTLGQAGMTRIGQAEQQAQAKSTQDLTNRGLGNTTITSAASRGVSNDAELQRQQLQEGVAAQKAGVMERKTEQGPDMSLYANLISQAAQKKQESGKWIGTSTVGPGGQISYAPGGHWS